MAAAAVAAAAKQRAEEQAAAAAEAEQKRQVRGVSVREREPSSVFRVVYCMDFIVVGVGSGGRGRVGGLVVVGVVLEGFRRWGGCG